MLKMFSKYIIIFIFIFTQSFILIKAEDTSGYSLISDILTIFPEKEINEIKAKGYDVQFNKYKPSRYSLELSVDNSSFLDLDGKVSGQAHILMNEFNNFIWQGLLSWDFMVVLLVQNAFSLDIVNQFSDSVEIAVQNISGFGKDGYQSSGIIGNFITLMIVISGIWLAYLGIVKKQISDAISGMFTTLAVFVLGLFFFSNTGHIMRYVNDLSSGLSQEVMGVGLAFQNSMSSSDITYPKEAASFVIADKLYNMFIYQPYLMLQYGKTTVDSDLNKERIESVLNQKVGSAYREKIIEGEKVGAGHAPNAMVTTRGTFDRLTLLIILGISHLILGILFLLIAGSMLVYQFLFVLMALFAPIAFLLSLNAAWSNTASLWFSKFIGYQLIKLIIGVFFSMLLTLSQFLYETHPPEKYGYVWTITLQLVLVIGVVWKRSDLISILQAPMNKHKSIHANLNVRLPINNITKYTENMANRVKRFTYRK